MGSAIGKTFYKLSRVKIKWFPHGRCTGRKVSVFIQEFFIFLWAFNSNFSTSFFKYNLIIRCEFTKILFIIIFPYL